MNRSWLGRALGGILLLWLASVSLGLPFKYGLAAALLAISAVLFLDWDRTRRGGASARSRMSTALAPVRGPAAPVHTAVPGRSSVSSWEAKPHHAPLLPPHWLPLGRA